VDLLPSSIAIPEAVAHLLGFLQFTPAKTVQLFRFGKGANVSGPLVNTAAVLPVGEDIGQTLMLCLHAAPLEGQQAEDLPAWERRPLKVSDLESDPTLALGPNDRYSRQSRAVLLLRDSTGNRVQWIHFAEGLGLKDDPQQPDRMACFRAGKLNSIRVTFSAGRSVWRDLPSLVPAPEGSDVRAAATIDSAAALNRALRKLVRSQQVLVAGLASDRGKALQWRVEQFNLPQALLTNPERALELKSHLAKCEAVYSQLRRWAFDLQVAVLPDPTSKETVKRAWDLVERGPLSSLYFAAAERSLWALMELVGRDASDEADLFWQRGLRQSALGAWQRVVDTLGMSADALRAEARCRRRLLAALREHLPLTAPPAQTRSSKGASA
jgi:CRISPR system Cascade subunit CasA